MNDPKVTETVTTTTEEVSEHEDPREAKRVPIEPVVTETVTTTETVEGE